MTKTIYCYLFQTITSMIQPTGGNLIHKCIMCILTTSSMISFIAETLSIKMRGTKVVYRPVGETSGICCNSAISKKNIFAHLLNCSNRKRGMNLIKLQKKVTYVKSNWQENKQSNVPVLCRRDVIANEFCHLGLCPVNEYHAVVCNGGRFLPFSLMVHRWRHCSIFFVWKEASSVKFTRK